MVNIKLLPVINTLSTILIPFKISITRFLLSTFHSVFVFSIMYTSDRLHVADHARIYFFYCAMHAVRASSLAVKFLSIRLYVCLSVHLSHTCFMTE